MKADHTGQNVVCISFKYVQTDKKNEWQFSHKLTFKIIYSGILVVESLETLSGKQRATWD